MAKPRPNPRASAPAPRPYTLTTGWAAAILALLVVLFFHEVALEGRTFTSPDAIAPAGFVRIGEQSLWKDHVYPLWNPFIFLGMPSFGSGAYNPLIYPPDWPLAILQKLLPFLPDLTWMLVYYVLGGLAVFLLAREWGARPEAALLGAAAYVFQPNLVAVGAYGHGSQLVNSMLLPLMLWLAARWMRRGSLVELGALALIGGFQFLRGHVQICFYTWLAIGLWVIVAILAALRTPRALPATLGRAVAIALAAALAFGVAGVYNLPLQDYARWSIRGGGEGGGVGVAYATSWSMAPYELPALAIPNAVGFGGATYWGGMPFTDYPNAFLGIVAVLLALPAFVRRGEGGAPVAPRAYALALGLFALFVSFGSHSPLYGWMYAHVPEFNKFRIPVMILVLFQLAAALALAWGWSAVLAGDGARPGTRALERVLLAAGALLAVLGIAGLFGQDALRGAYVHAALAHKPDFSPEAAAAAYAGFAADLGKVVIVGLLAVGGAWLALKRRLSATTASLALFALLLFDVWPVSGMVMKPRIADRQQASLETGRDDVVDFLEKQGPWGSFRVLAPEPQLFQDNRLGGFGIATVGGYHAAKTRLFQDLLDRGAVFTPRWLALLNVRYLFVSQPIPPDQMDRALGPIARVLKPVFQGSGGAVYENLLALPRATVVGAYGIVADTGRAAIDSVAAGSHSPATYTWLTRAPGFPSGDETRPAGEATITHYGLHDVQLDVTANVPAVVRLADLWYPDWTATVDGRRVPVLRADHALRAVVVTPGRHRVAFRFVSASFRSGLALSLASAAIALLVIGVGVWRERRPRPARPAEAA